MVRGRDDANQRRVDGEGSLETRGGQATFVESTFRLPCGRQAERIAVFLRTISSY